MAIDISGRRRWRRATALTTFLDSLDGRGPSRMPVLEGVRGSKGRGDISAVGSEDIMVTIQFVA